MLRAFRNRRNAGPRLRCGKLNSMREWGKVTRWLCSQAGTLPGRQRGRQAGRKAGIMNIVLIFKMKIVLIFNISM